MSMMLSKIVVMTVFYMNFHLHVCTVKQKTELSDFLLFLKRVASSSIIQKMLSGQKWISIFLTLSGYYKSTEEDTHHTYSLRTRLNALSLLHTVLLSFGADTDQALVKQVITVFSSLTLTKDYLNR